MWFIADLFERYTTRVSKTFLKIAAMEAEANKTAQEKRREEREARNLESPARALLMRDPLTGKRDEIRAEERAALAAKAAVAAVEAEPVATLSPVVPVETSQAAPVSDMPMGVRGDVVLAWAERLTSAERREIPGQLEKLRKDKKVRVPELQMICAKALGESPQVRKKGEHLSALKARFAPGERVRTAEAVELQAAAG